jgi:predicted RNA binding protein YcfA (HicA-like mRNA interferase family)
MPRKIRDLIRDLEQAGFYLVKGGGKGDHRKFRHQRLPGSLTLDGKTSGDAHHYQEKQVRAAIHKTQS